MSEPSQIVHRLTRLCTSVRRRLVLYGLFVLMTAAVSVFLALMVLDWLLHFPPPLRLALSAAFLAGVVCASVHWVFRPLHARFGVSQIASRLERHFTPLQDRLTSSVDFIERADAGSPSMMRTVVDRTERMIREVPLESALTLRPLVRHGALLAASVAALAAVVAVSPSWARVGAFRYLHPWAEIEWPRKVSILPLTGDQIVAVGDSLTVRMRVQRGLKRVRRAIVHLGEKDGTVQPLAMQKEGEETFYATIDAVTQDLTYWFQAGDDSTERNPYTIRVANRPEVVEALALVEPPPYAQDQSPRLHDLADGPINAPTGGEVEVVLRTNKPITPTRPPMQAVLRGEDGALIPLEADADEARVLRTRLAVARDLRFRAELIDEHGFANRGAVTHVITAVPDMPPGVTVVEPKGATDVTAHGSVSVSVRVEDDFGVERLDLEFEPLGGERRTIPLTRLLEGDTGGTGSERTVRYVWEMAPLGLSPGRAIEYEWVAWDNRTAVGSRADGDEAGPQVGRSAPMQIKIISEVEFEDRLRSDLAHVETRIRQVLLEQTDVMEQVTALRDDSTEPRPLDELEQQTAGHLGNRQGRLTARVREVVNRLDRLLARIEANLAGEDEFRAHLVRVGGLLRDIAAGPMTLAIGELEHVRDGSDAAFQQASVAAARTQQLEAVDRLRGVLALMSEWGSFQELVTRAVSLADRQDALQRQTGELGRRTLGKSVESLSETEANALGTMAREQDQLADEIEQLEEKMNRLRGPEAESASSEDRDQAAARESIDAALRAARAHGVRKHARWASDAIRANRTAAATLEQKATVTALRKILSALREREERQLEALQKRLGRLEETIALLIEEQESLRRATHEATLIETEGASLELLGETQRGLRRNAEQLGEELGLAQRTRSVGELLGESAERMASAEQELESHGASPALTAQDEALALLHDALELVQELARETEQQVLRRSLAKIREDLEQILAAQIEVNEGIEGLLDAIVERGRIGRVEARTAGKLANKQAEIRTLVDTQRPDFEKVPVYRWVLGRVSKWMTDSRVRLSGRQLDRDLLVVVDRIVRELRQLINAIRETETFPLDKEFMEAEQAGGQGQGGGSGDQRPLPTLAELLVLKSMQADINERTRSIHASFDPEQATEAVLSELKIIGEDQAELRRLTERVTEGAQHP